VTGLAVYPGSFDPPTLGHLSLVARGLALFDRLIVAVASNSAKTALFSLEERLGLLRESLAGYGPEQVEVDSFEGLSVEYARRRQATALLRGLRGSSDFEYEFQMALANHHLAPGLESVFLMTDHRWLYLSSTLVKEVAAHGADITTLVPPPVIRALQAKFPHKVP
jgi:pantetheine-phosphate adenylyltransferase